MGIFHDFQLFQIRKGIDNDIDYRLYADPKYHHRHMYYIRQILILKLDVSYLLNPNLSPQNVVQIFNVLKKEYKKKSTIQTKIALIILGDI